MLSLRVLDLALAALSPGSRLTRRQPPKKNLPWAGFEERGCSWLIGSEAEEFGRNSIQAVVAHHLEDDVDQHSSDVEGSHQSQASPEFFSCCWGLIVGPGAGSVGHRLIATSITLAKELVGVQQSSLTFTSERMGSIGEHQRKLGIAALA